MAVGVAHRTTDRIPRELSSDTRSPKDGPPHVPYYRLGEEDIVELCALIHAADTGADRSGWPPILGLFKSVVVALTYLRRNHVQQELAEYYGVSQSSISRAITAITPRLAQVLSPFTPTAEELPPAEQLIVDGTLVSCWSWDNHTELYSGKHRTTGLNIQVVCDLAGRLRWISDPDAGGRNDTAALRASGALDGIDPQNWIGDKGYVGLGMITPIKKPLHRDLFDWEKEFNTAVNRIRWKIEQTIANLKTWRILHTDYRRPLTTFRETISAVVGLQFYRFSVGSPGGIAPPGSHRTERDSLPSFRSSHPLQSNVRVRLQWVNSPGSRSRSPVHHWRNLLYPRSRLYLLRAHRIR